MAADHSGLCTDSEADHFYIARLSRKGSSQDPVNIHFRV